VTVGSHRLLNHKRTLGEDELTWVLRQHVGSRTGPRPIVNQSICGGSRAAMSLTKLGVALSFLLLLLFGLSPPLCEAAEETWQAGLSVYHSSGDYGTGSTTVWRQLDLRAGDN
jgi:hypothetical protein